MAWRMSSQVSLTSCVCVCVCVCVCERERERERQSCLQQSTSLATKIQMYTDYSKPCHHLRTFRRFYSILLLVGAKWWREEEEEEEMNGRGGRGETRIFPYLRSTLLNAPTYTPSPGGFRPHSPSGTSYEALLPRPWTKDSGRLLSSFDQNPKNYKNDFSEVQTETQSVWVNCFSYVWICFLDEENGEGRVKWNQRDEMISLQRLH